MVTELIGFAWQNVLEGSDSTDSVLPRLVEIPQHRAERPMAHQRNESFAQLAREAIQILADSLWNRAAVNSSLPRLLSPCIGRSVLGAKREASEVVLRQGSATKRRDDV